MEPHADLARIDWHRVGMVISLASHAVMLVAAVATPPGLSRSGWLWLVGSLPFLAVIYLAVRRHQSLLWWLVWPVTGIIGVGVFGLVDHQAAELVTGLIVVWFLYCGLTQPRGRSLLLLPLALVVLQWLLGLSLPLALVRLPLAAVVWALVGELPAYLRSGQVLLARAAGTDPLTGARNRHGLADLLFERRGKAHLVMLDLDHFKTYNDTFGHPAGDLVLRDFAAMLAAGTRGDDVVIRYGGEEFLVVLAGVDSTLARRVVQRWVQSWRSHPSGLSFSAGITYLDSDEALERADMFLYAAKNAGRARVVMGPSAGGAFPPEEHLPVLSPVPVQPSNRVVTDHRVFPGPG